MNESKSAPSACACPIYEQDPLLAVIPPLHITVQIVTTASTTWNLSSQPSYYTTSALKKISPMNTYFTHFLRPTAIWTSHYKSTRHLLHNSFSHTS